MLPWRFLRDVLVNEESLEQQLAAGATALGLQLASEQLGQLLLYLKLLARWNRTYNLTAVATVEQGVTRHLLDSLSIVPYVRGKRFLDVGSGAGLPGIPLAIVLRDRCFTLLDSNGKKVRFLCHVRSELKLANVQEVQSRVESYQYPAGFDGVISRAYSALGKFTTSSDHLLKGEGYFYAMKSRCKSDELSLLPERYRVVADHPLRVPGLDGHRRLIVINRA